MSQDLTNWYGIYHKRGYMSVVQKEENMRTHWFDLPHSTKALSSQNARYDNLNFATTHKVI